MQNISKHLLKRTLDVSSGWNNTVSNTYSYLNKKNRFIIPHDSSGISACSVSIEIVWKGLPTWSQCLFVSKRRYVCAGAKTTSGHGIVGKWTHAKTKYVTFSVSIDSSIQYLKKKYYLKHFETNILIFKSFYTLVSFRTMLQIVRSL